VRWPYQKNVSEMQKNIVRGHRKGSERAHHILSGLLKGDSLHAQKFIDPDAKSASQYINFSPNGSATSPGLACLREGPFLPLS